MTEEHEYLIKKALAELREAESELSYGKSCLTTRIDPNCTPGAHYAEAHLKIVRAQILAIAVQHSITLTDEDIEGW